MNENITQSNDLRGIAEGLIESLAGYLAAISAASATQNVTVENATLAHVATEATWAIEDILRLAHAHAVQLIGENGQRPATAFVSERIHELSFLPTTMLDEPVAARQ